MTTTTKMMKNRENWREENNAYTIFYVFTLNRMISGRDTTGAERYVFFSFQWFYTIIVIIIINK